MLHTKLLSDDQVFYLAQLSPWIVYNKGLDRANHYGPFSLTGCSATYSMTRYPVLV
jgi:hypothetical protein